MRVLINILVLIGIGAGSWALGSYWGGRSDAKRYAHVYAQQANSLIAQGYGGVNLGPGRLAMLLKVEDPNFLDHNGTDTVTLGAGRTTLTQAVSKHLGFKDFKPGLSKIRQTGFAKGLEGELSKDQILALFLHHVPMGLGPDGWIDGIFPASKIHFNKLPNRLTDAQFTALIAVMIAPATLTLGAPNAALNTRIDRIDRMLKNQCRPASNADVWLEGCA